MKLDLPQLTAELSSPVFYETKPRTTLALVAGGRPPQTDWLQQTTGHCTALWAIDRGIDSCQQAQLLPARLIGDADSASSGSWQWAERQGVPVDKFAPAKDLTDLQLSLELSRQDFPNSLLIVTGVFGGRLDHAMSLLFTLAHDRRPCCLADEKELLLILRSGEKADITINAPWHEDLSAVSLLPLTAKCEGLSITGVRWPLDEAELTQQLPYAVSNELLSTTKKISVSLTDGVVGVYMLFGTMTA